MSSGIVHTKACLALSVGFVTGTIVTGDTSGLHYALGSLIGILISCDADVDSGSISDTFIRKRIGWVMEKAWDTLWYFYRRSLKHGSELSHFPGIGTAGRILYLFFFVLMVPTFLLSIVLPIDFVHEINWWWGHLLGEWRILLGLAGADCIHYGLDILTTEHVHKTRPRKSPWSLLSSR